MGDRHRPLLARPQAPHPIRVRALYVVRLRADSFKQLLSRLNKVVSTGKLICEFALLPGQLGAREEKDQRHSYLGTSNVSVY